MSAGNTTREKQKLSKSYSSTIMESNGSSVSNGSGGSGDLTARNHSRHQNENSEHGSSNDRSIGDNQGDGAAKEPHFHQTLSMDDGGSSHAALGKDSSLLTWSFYLLLGGIFLGLVLPKNPSLPSRILWQWATLSNIVGYTYFLAW